MDDGCLFLNKVDFVRIWLTYFAEKVVVFHEKGTDFAYFSHHFTLIWADILLGYYMFGVAVEMMPHIVMC